jgi:transketolase
MRGELPADWPRTRAALARRPRRQRAAATRKSSQARARTRRPGAAGADRRFGRPDRLEQHHWQGSKRRDARRRRQRQLRLLRRARVRHDRDHERLALHGGFIPYGGTFLVFSDYARNAVRMAALMQVRVIFVLHARLDRPRRGRPDAPADRARREPARDPEHDALAPLRRGRDRGRVARRDRARDGPTALVLTRQALPHSAHAEQLANDRARRLRAARAATARRSVVIATGSEVALALAARQRARPRGRARARRVDALRECSSAGRGLPRIGAAGRRARGSRSRPARRLAGGATSAGRGASSASTASARPRRPRICSSTSASRSSASPKAVRALAA